MQGHSHPHRSFLDVELEKQVSRSGFLDRVDAVMDWTALSPHWAGLYGKTGKPSYPPLVVFKMLLLQHWFNGLSDEDVEWQCRDRLSFRKFLGVSTAEEIPDATTLVRFRNRLIKAGVMQSVFDAVTGQLEDRHLILKRGTLVDATIVESARTPPPKREDRGDHRDVSDPDAAWAIKNNRPIAHGYKAHKAYDDAERRTRLRRQGIRPRILHKAKTHHPLTFRQFHENRRWSRVRSQVERIFADWKARRSLWRARYVGLKRNTLHVMLLATAHNLRRWTVLAQG